MKKSLFIIISLFSVFFACKTTEEKSSQLDTKSFTEPFRPQYHFSPEANWMNDPNGMVYLDGEYHLFYQYYPDSTVWGPMHWGHAVSTDLVHWEHLPIAIYPDKNGWIFSGSAVIDHNNTSGLGSPQNPAMIAIFTYHDPVGEKEGRVDFQTQGIAYSLDKGRTWTVYADNPVLKNPGIKDFRDPKVRWYADSEGNGKWIMSLAVWDKISFYSSPNLLDWTFESDFNPDWAAYGGVWECPDLFPLTDTDGTQKWILFVSINPGGPQGGSATQYFVGNFDGKTFSTESSETLWLDYGADNYAGVTWSNVPESDGRTLFIGWMSNWQYAQIVPTHPWRSATTLPRNLELVKKDNGYLVASRPVKEIEKLRTESITVSGNSFELENELVELLLSPNQEDFKIHISNDKGDRVIIEKSDQELKIDRTQSGFIDFSTEFPAVHNAPLHAIDVKNIRLFIDRSSIEIFINDGELVMTELVFPTFPFTNVNLEGISDSNTLHYLNGIW
ncbi:fructan beta-fructosidase [Aquiflexum balticum DSM 16537]|uniref:Fructan beta-fructosidase n=1 Tax=Aquiflexum balticum DSM 16537 TaxID=758820 RepID=A0A1W2H711_9BACT|nr:glycoside hydrolase family 32 protein [Aquiflexum balticum]SMD44276.1 fructan beta-fructosidase [Aquiflexum balticum DSM 16537]